MFHQVDFELWFTLLRTVFRFELGWETSADGAEDVLASEVAFIDLAVDCDSGVDWNAVHFC